MSNNGCKDLANAIRGLQSMSAQDRERAIKNMQTIQCVSCQQEVSLDNIVTGGSLNIGAINQIQSCGIGNSSSTEMASLLNKYINDSSKQLKNEFNNNLSKRTNDLNNNIEEVHTRLHFDLKTAIQIFGVIAGVLFILILIRIVMKIIKL